MNSGSESVAVVLPNQRPQRPAHDGAGRAPRRGAEPSSSSPHRRFPRPHQRPPSRPTPPWKYREPRHLPRFERPRNGRTERRRAAPQGVRRRRVQRHLLEASSWSPSWEREPGRWPSRPNSTPRPGSSPRPRLPAPHRLHPGRAARARGTLSIVDYPGFEGLSAGHRDLLQGAERRSVPSLGPGHDRGAPICTARASTGTP